MIKFSMLTALLIGTLAVEGIASPGQSAALSLSTSGLMNINDHQMSPQVEKIDILLGQVSLEEEGASLVPEPEEPEYSCIYHSGRFLTVAKTPRGKIPLIVWQSEVFGAQWTPEARCKAVSGRFQAFARNDQLDYISTGELNNYPIICVSEEYGDCLSNGLLLTLEPKDNPTQVLKSLFDLSDAITRSTTKPVIDLEYMLEEKNVLEPEANPVGGAFVEDDDALDISN